MCPLPAEQTMKMRSRTTQMPVIPQSMCKPSGTSSQPLMLVSLLRPQTENLASVSYWHRVNKSSMASHTVQTHSMEEVFGTGCEFGTSLVIVKALYRRDAKAVTRTKTQLPRSISSRKAVKVNSGLTTE